MTESQVVNRWLQQGEQAGLLKSKREDLLLALQARFPGAVTPEMIEVINHQESVDLLRDWFRAVLQGGSLEDFLKALRQ